MIACETRIFFYLQYESHKAHEKAHGINFGFLFIERETAVIDKRFLILMQILLIVISRRGNLRGLRCKFIVLNVN